MYNLNIIYHYFLYRWTYNFER